MYKLKLKIVHWLLGDFGAIWNFDNTTWEHKDGKIIASISEEEFFKHGGVINNTVLGFQIELNYPIGFK